MEKQEKVIAVILCGGSGNRLWPLSTVNLSKPFIPLPDGETLIEKTYRRALNIANLDLVITLTNQKYEEQCREEFAKMDTEIKNLMVSEPAGRDTAPAILMAALTAQKISGDDALLLVMPSDHLIQEEDQFLECAKKALQTAQKGKLVTFGMQTQGPETAYGYLWADEEQEPDVFDIRAFVEKPDHATAEKYHASSGYFWNSGIFCFRTGTILQEFQNLQADLYNIGIQVREQSDFTEGFVGLDKESFATMQKISFDYAIMEKTDKASMVKTGFHWKDVGSWTGYADLLQPDAMNNSMLGNAKIYMKDVRHNILFFSKPDRKIALIGLDNLVVIETEEGLLIADKQKIQEVKDAANYFINPDVS